MPSPLPVTSWVVIMYAAMLHAIEATMFLTTTAANGSVGMSALLMLTNQNAVYIAYVMLLSAAAAAYTLSPDRIMHPLLVVLCLAPQQALLLTTGIGAWMAVWHGAYADGVVRSPFFITADQLPRGMFSLIHMSSIYTLTVYHGYRGRHVRYQGQP